MNIFKKTFKLNFFNRIELRVVEALKTQIPKEIKKLNKEITTELSRSFFFLLISSLIFYFTNQSDQFVVGLINFLSVIIIGVSILSLPFCILFHFTDNFKLKKFATELSYGTPNYHSLVHYFSLEKITELTSEEIKELFSMPLNNEQIKFLQNHITQKTTFNLADLHYLADILSEEEVLQQKKNNLQEKLKNFISVHQLENCNSSYLSLNNEEIKNPSSEEKSYNQDYKELL